MKTALLAVLVVLSLAACDRSTPSRSGALPAGDLREERITFEFAIYYLPNPLTPPIAELDRRLSDTTSLFKRIEKLSEQGRTPRLAARVERDPQANYAPPAPDVLQRFAHGLTSAQADALQKTQSALILDFAYSQEDVWSALRAALDLTHQLAKATGGIIWDATTREVFTPDAWVARRITAWTTPVPRVSDYTVIHAYPSGDHVRSITLGMEKLGLPDIVINESSWSQNRNVGHIINMFCQVLAEGAVVRKAGEFDLDFRSIRNPDARDAQLETLKSNATAVARLSLRTGKWEAGDPRNRLLEITFDRGIGPDLSSKREQIIGEAFGADDSVVTIEHDNELLEASRQARNRLGSLHAAFNKGLQPGEFLDVKAPFDTRAGRREWMWVEVTSWKGKRISGPLQNDPSDVPTLHAGQIVTVSQDDVFDYIFNRADGTTEGNETGRIIQSRNGAR